MAHLPREVKAAITKFDTAAQNAAYVGAADPEDRPAIEHAHERARENLERAIQRVMGG